MAPYHLGGIAMLTISLDDYIVRSITLYDKQYQEHGYTEYYSTSEHDQIQAFECLETICEEEEVGSSIGQIKEEDEAVSLVGPKRLEITLRAVGGASEKKLVVTDVMPPAAHYKYYSVAGREWKVYQKKLDRVPITLWGSSYWLARIGAYLTGGEGSATEHYTPQNQENAWGALARMFYKFKPAELNVIKNWTMDSGDAADDNDWGYGGEFYGPNYRSQHWTNRTPSTYAPKEAQYRVAGDEVGAVIHREQRKAWEDAGSPSPEETLKAVLEPKIEKKDEAGEADADSSTDSSASDDRCRECGGDECPSAYCIQDVDLAAFGGVVADGRYTVH